MWTWTCTACNEAFGGETKDEAERLFIEHAQTEHNAKVILSTTTEGEVA